MALIVETGPGVAGANSYTSLADAMAFINARDLSVALTEGLLLRAMDVLNVQTFKGAKTEAGNSLPWPRIGVYDCDDTLGASDFIPPQIIHAQIWLAFYIQSDSDPAAVPEPAIKSEKVDVIETVYAVKDGSTTAINPVTLPNVRNALKCFITPIGMGLIDRA